MGNKDKKKRNEHEAAETTVGPRDADFSTLEEDMEGQHGTTSSSSSVSESKGQKHTALEQEISKLKAEVEENKDKYLRSLAEMENYKKRTLKERSELLKYQGDKLVFDLLEVLDNLEWAVSHSSADPEKVKAGLELILKLFVDVLGRWEIRGSSSVGKEFDPIQHQAISKVAVDDAKPGTVINEFKKAYFYKDKLLRPGDVVVAVSKDMTEEASSEEATKEELSGEGDETAK